MRKLSLKTETLPKGIVGGRDPEFELMIFALKSINCPFYPVSLIKLKLIDF